MTVVVGEIVFKGELRVTVEIDEVLASAASWRAALEAARGVGVPESARVRESYGSGTREVRFDFSWAIAAAGR